MATEAVARSGDGLKAPVVLPGRRYDHYFFSGMALLMLATVFEGFARTYYLAGVLHAPRQLDHSCARRSFFLLDPFACGSDVLDLSRSR